MNADKVVVLDAVVMTAALAAHLAGYGLDANIWGRASDRKVIISKGIKGDLAWLIPLDQAGYF